MHPYSGGGGQPEQILSGMCFSRTSSRHIQAGECSEAIWGDCKTPSCAPVSAYVKHIVMCLIWFIVSSHTLAQLM